MSSLAATQADGYYFPPEWRPEFGGLSKYQGSKGANQYQQHGIVRFELPFDGWCLKCDRHICKGHRFNAKKEKIGKYFSTILYSFTTTCPSPSCSQTFVIKTDPENRTYDYAEGLRAMVQDFTPGPNDSIIETTSEETKQMLENDPIFKLQHDRVGKIKADTVKASLEKLISVQDDQFKNDFDSNSLLRKRMRAQKHKREDLLKEGNAIGLSIPLAEPCEDDKRIAQRVKFKNSRADSFKRKERQYLAEVVGSSIFSVKSVKKRVGMGSGDKNVTKKRIRSEIISKETQRSHSMLKAMKKQAIQNINTSAFSMTNIEGKSATPFTAAQIVNKTLPSETASTSAAFALKYANYSSSEDEC